MVALTGTVAVPYQVALQRVERAAMFCWSGGDMMRWLDERTDRSVRLLVGTLGANINRVVELESGEAGMFKYTIRVSPHYLIKPEVEENQIRHWAVGELTESCIDAMFTTEQLAAGRKMRDGSYKP